MQIFRGHFTNDPSRTNVAVKIFQQSYLPLPSHDDFLRAEYEDSDASRLYDGFYLPATAFAQKEAWAYDQLQSVQGGFIPYSFGFYMFVLPSGEEVVGHIMEEIHGTEIETYFANQVQTSVPRMWQLADAITWALHAIHGLGVVHDDVASRNLRVLTRGDGSLKHIVLFDFGLAKQTVSKQSDRYARGGDGAAVAKCIRKAAELTGFYEIVSFGESRRRLDEKLRNVLEFGWLHDCVENRPHWNGMFCSVGATDREFFESMLPRDDIAPPAIPDYRTMDRFYGCAVDSPVSSDGE